MKVVVTGGSGFVGKRLQLVHPEWTYASRKDVELLSYDECLNYFRKERPDAVIHLAAKVGGIKDNSDHPADFFYQNLTINSNVVHACYVAGVKRLLASLSTCAFPDVVKEYPFSEADFLDGPPAPTNRGYGFTKRALHIQIQSYRQQYGLEYSCFCPSNLYGPEDNFHSEKSHFVAAMIKKFHAASVGDTVEFWGTGKTLKQQLYVDDLCLIIPQLLEKHRSDLPLIVAPYENMSVLELIQATLPVANKNLKVTFNGKLEGQYRKDGSNSELLKLCPSFSFTPFTDGVRKTYEWYEKNYRL